jgi:hypothetical protein
MDSLIDDAWSRDHSALRNAMIELQDCEEESPEWTRAAEALDKKIAIYLESPMAEHVRELQGISNVIRREEIYAAEGITDDEELKTMGEEDCEAELKDVGRKLETLDMLEELIQEGQDKLAEFSDMLEDTESYGWKGDEYRKLRDEVHVFLRADVSMSVDEISKAAGSLMESAEAFAKTNGSASVKEIAEFSRDFAKAVDEKGKKLGSREPLDEMQGRLDARMEELIDVSERHRIKKNETSREVNFAELNEKENSGKSNRKAINREAGSSQRNIGSKLEGFFGKR